VREDQPRQTLARAIEMVIDKGFTLKSDFHLRVEACGTVPAKMTVKGEVITLTKSYFHQIEVVVVGSVVQMRIEAERVTEVVSTFFILE